MRQFARPCLVLLLAAQFLHAASGAAGPANKAVAVSKPLAISTRRCPKWFLDYEQFHAEQRGKPNATYLIHKSTANPLSGGLGDRLRGMLFTLRAAHASRRVVLFNWLHPFPTTEFFVPAGPINWTMQGIAQPDNGTDGDSKQYEFNHMQEMPFNSSVDGNTTFVTFVTNKRMDAGCKDCPYLDSRTWAAACVWRRLLRPTDEILARAQQQLVQIYNDTDPKYTAVHLRVGGLTGEISLTPGQQAQRTPNRTALDNFVAASRCARKLQQQQDTDNTPARSNGGSKHATLLLTDSHVLRTFVQEGGLPGFVSPPSLPVHLHMADNQSLAEHQNTVVELVLLARAACLVRSPSGFSHHAWLLGGGKRCSKGFTRCDV